MNALLVTTYLALQAAVIVWRYRLFRIDGRTPRGARVIEWITLACIVTNVGLLSARPPAPLSIDAIALSAAASAGALLAWARRTVRPRQLSAAFSPDLPTELIARGPYRFVRNPFYLAYLLGHAVPLVATRSPWAALGWVVMLLIYRHAALLEERKFLGSALADEYRRYAGQTGRFLPRW